MNLSNAIPLTNQIPTEGQETQSKRVMIVLGYDKETKQFYPFDPVCCAWGPCSHAGYQNIASKVGGATNRLSLPVGFAHKKKKSDQPYYRAIIKVDDNNAVKIIALENLQGGEEQAWQERQWLSVFYSTGEAGPLSLNRLFR